VIAVAALLAIATILPPEGGRDRIGNGGGKEARQAQPPVRDTRPVVAGPPAAIAGVVVSDEGRPRPLRRARVTVTGSALQIPRTAITKDDGTFELGGLPAGRYTLAAQKDAYVTMIYGAARPGRPGRPVMLNPGDRQSLTIALPRGAVITGTITDTDGQPAQGVQVTASSRGQITPLGDRRFVMGGVGPSASDDRGVYRIYGLPAGEYVIAAQPQLRAVGLPVREVLPMSAAGPRARAVTATPVFFPGATDVARAARVTLTAGEERTGIDVQLQYVPLAIVSGSVQVTPGMTPPIIAMARLGEIGGPDPVTTSRADADGRFTFNAVRPGQYMLIARAGQASPVTTSGSPLIVPPGPIQWSTAEVAVDGDDVMNVALSPQPTIAIAGRFAFEGARPVPELGAIRLPMTLAAQTIGSYQVPLPQIQLEPGGRFVLTGILPGVYRLGSLQSQPIQGIRSAIGGWWLKSVVVNGRDILDAPLDIRQGSDDAVATLTDQASEISGTVKDAHGAAAVDPLVVVFSTDRALWFFNSRRVAAVRVDGDGRYTIRNLPPGEYRAVATADLEQNDWFDPAVLERLAPAATPLSIAGVEKKTIDLTVR
jgi:protocatechuate 3,4-dioxygenase beta subunit